MGTRVSFLLVALFCSRWFCCYFEKAAVAETDCLKTPPMMLVNTAMEKLPVLTVIELSLSGFKTPASATASEVIAFLCENPSPFGLKRGP